MTRTTDTDVTHQQRCDIANNSNCDIFVSIHCNSHEDESAHGTETYYYPGSVNGLNSLDLAKRVQSELVKQIGLTDRGTKSETYYVLKHTKMPAVLTEIAFISNQSEFNLLNDSAFRQKAAQGIANGILRYLENRGFTITAYGPVDIIVTDPDGLRISKQLNEIPGATYTEADVDGDGIVDSNEQNPTYTYDEAGTYTVSLTVYEADGDSDTETKTDYITVTSAVDTEPPTIESVTLDTYMNIPNSSFHVTVNATDNVGVASVTADGINLTKKDNIWEGDIYIPPETHEGKYNITIIAEDDAGNFNKTTVYYSVVIPTGGLGVVILPKISSASPGSEMKLDIKVVSTENFDDIVHINLTLEGILTDFQANLSWFNWTNKTVMIPIEGEIVLPIAIEIPNGTSPGYKSFGVYVESKRWHSSAQDYGAIMVG